MAEQEFLASFGVEIDESGVRRLQEVLTQNRELAEELAAAFDRARAAVQGFFRELSELPFTGFDLSGAARFRNGHGHHARPDRPGPAQHDPREPPNIPVHKGAALGFGEVLAVRREPRQPNAPPAAFFHRIDGKHVFSEMPRPRMILPVQHHRRLVVIDRNGYRPPHRQLDPHRRAARPGEIVHNQPVKNPDLRAFPGLAVL